LLDPDADERNNTAVEESGCVTEDVRKLALLMDDLGIKACVEWAAAISRKSFNLNIMFLAGLSAVCVEQ